MQPERIAKRWPVVGTFSFAGAVLGLLVTLGLDTPARGAEAPPPAPTTDSNYIIGPGDGLQVFVWHNPDLTASVPVRPDGKISIPLVEDIPSAGKTPTQLARDIEERLRRYVQDPTVTVIMNGFIGLPSQQIRIVGAAAAPKAVPYRENMSVLDAMIDVGGLSTYAAGNRAKLIRRVNGQQVTTVLKLENLLEDGDLSANLPLQPGDVIIIPQSFF